MSIEKNLKQIQKKQKRSLGEFYEERAPEPCSPSSANW